jgi:hypothetical protein
VSCLESPNVVDIRGGHPQATGGNNSHGKVFIPEKKGKRGQENEKFSFTV